MKRETNLGKITEKGQGRSTVVCYRKNSFVFCTKQWWWA